MNATSPDYKESEPDDSETENRRVGMTKQAQPKEKEPSSFFDFVKNFLNTISNWIMNKIESALGKNDLTNLLRGFISSLFNKTN